MSELAAFERCAIAFCLNDRFLPPACALLESIGRHGGALEGLTLVAIATNLSERSMHELQRCASSNALALQVRIVTDTDGLGAISETALSTCLRLYLGEMCHDFERVLYLDCDMLVLSELAPLIRFDLQGRTAAATINHPPFSVMRVAIPRSRRASAAADAAYFNAGVLLIDVHRWKERAVGERARAYISEYPDTRLLDQDALNIALANDWCHLDKEWNSPAGPLDGAPMLRGLAHIDPSMARTLEQWAFAQAQPRILHFTGQPKPWERDYLWRDLSEMYARYMLPAFASQWPSSKQAVAGGIAGEQRLREFRRM